MAIRLNKVVRDLNITFDRAINFLEEKGIQLEGGANAKISDEQYDMLVNEFSSDKKLKTDSEKISQVRQNKDRSKPQTVAIDDYKPKDEDNEIKTTIPDDKQPQIKTVGHINLDEINGHKKTQKAEDRDVAPAEQTKTTAQTAETTAMPQQMPAEEPQEPAVEKDEIKQSEEPKADSQPGQQEAERTQPANDAPSKPASSSEEVFRLHPETKGARINVVGRINLDALNQTTRPKKKSRDEKRKEREDKERQRVEQRKKMKEDIIKEIRKDDATTGKAAGEKKGDEETRKKKRSRINKERIDIDNIQAQGERNRRTQQQGGQTRQGQQQKNAQGKGKKAAFAKPEVTEEDVAKQVKETLARLTSKGKNKAAKYRKEKREQAHTRQAELESKELEDSKVLKLTEFVTANELASMMDVPVTQVIATCMSVGIMVSINQRLDAETINLVAEEFGFKTEYVSASFAQAVAEEADREEDLQPRPPIVTVMGHVDHGKTSLLDYIRKSNVIAGEAGGITQHIGAYNVKLDDGRRITFLDTPGHEAFTAMRARGAKVTDIAIIIVAADDSVMPQTKEAINHASAAGVPIVFAINKIDKPNANPDRIKEELANMNYLIEEWGGKYQSQDISAKKGTGVNELLEKVLLEAEMLELKANPERKATGSIIESTLDKGRGYVATVLVSNGTLKIGDIVLAGTHYGKIKAMFNERNQRIKQAGPSEPALILGLNGAPTAGDTFHVIETEQEAREIANKREQLQREQGIRTQKLLTLDEVGRRIALGSFQELNIIVKGDVDGSIEALSDSLIKLSTEKIQINVIHKAVGQISESDVSLAAASNAIIIGFQVRPSAAARKLAEQEGVDIRLYSIIYDAIEQVKDAMAGLLAPELKEEVTATIEVLEVFHISKVGTVAGGMVKEGKVKRTDKARLVRDGIVVYTGNINALKRFKDDVKEVAMNYECGISLVNYNDIKVGDIIETYEEVEVKATL